MFLDENASWNRIGIKETVLGDNQNACHLSKELVRIIIVKMIVKILLEI